MGMKAASNVTQTPGPRRAATGFASGADATPELAAHAVTQALSRCDADMAQGIILLLTPHFARHPQVAISAAARAGHCLQVAGGTTPGVFTEHAWTLDQPAAAALVLTSGLTLAAATGVHANAPRLSLTMPDGLDRDWLKISTPRFGALATGNEHHSVSAVWNHGKWQPEGRIDAVLGGVDLELAISRGMHALSDTLEVDDVDGYELLLLNDKPPLETLLPNLPPEIGNVDKFPSNLIFAAIVDAEIGLEQAVAEGRYALAPIIASNSSAGTVTLGATLEPGMQMFWALRHPHTAVTELRRGITLIQESRPAPPDFALMFSCIGRGPYFYGGTDQDLAMLANRYPGLPVLGGYCGGEIAPLTGGNAILSYSTVTVLAWADVQS